MTVIRNAGLQISNDRFGLKGQRLSLASRRIDRTQQGTPIGVPCLWEHGHLARFGIWSTGTLPVLEMWRALYPSLNMEYGQLARF